METEIAKLNKLKTAENWTNWRFQVKILMIANECFAVANGTMSKLVLQGTENQQEQAMYNRDLSKWLKLDGVAQKLIALNVSDEVLPHIIDCQTSKEMWQKLEEIFEGKAEMNIYMLQQKWFSLTRDPKDDMATHIAKIKSLSHKMIQMSEQISNNMIMTKILMTIPPEFSHFVAAWESTSQAERTIENLTVRLTLEERRRVP